MCCCDVRALYQGTCRCCVKVLYDELRRGDSIGDIYRGVVRETTEGGCLCVAVVYKYHDRS